MDLEELVIKAQQGDEAAYEEICLQFEPLVKKYGYQHHLSGIKEDALCEARLAVAEAVQKYNPAEGIAFAGYVKARVHYAIWNLFKRERRRWDKECSMYSETDDGVIPLDISDELDLAEQVSDRIVFERNCHVLCSALKDLTLKQRSIIVHCVMGKTSLRIAAGKLGITVQAAHSIKLRALKRLKKEFIEHSGQNPYL